MRADRLRPGQPGGLAEADVGGRRGAHFELPDRDRVLGLERIALGTAPQQPAAALGGVGPPRGHHVEHGHADRHEVGVLLHDLRGDAVALPDQTQQDVLGADVVVVQLERLAQRELEGLLRPRRERDVPARRVGPGADHDPDLFTRAVARYPEAGQDAAGVPLGLAEQTEQDVLGADVVVMQLPRFLLGKHDGVPGSVRESLKHEIKGAPPFTPRQYHANNRLWPSLRARWPGEAINVRASMYRWAAKNRPIGTSMSGRERRRPRRAGSWSGRTGSTNGSSS